ncbi:MAG: hypothetical protein C4547_04850 [Phycisphaerales bacterium]|nr:MAG: hypothetical protein C4547_04850 [Phycisphaerales bacterium]
MFDVLHPDQAVVTRGYVSLGMPPEAADNGSVYETTVKLAILHITELRPLRRRARARKKQGSRRRSLTRGARRWTLARLSR